ncbi:hypothetical protein [Corynebacterium sp. HMSC072G08]|nr:hypothetical protein [Corynebacterium sp. HMSC072G08]
MSVALLADAPFAPDVASKVTAVCPWAPGSPTVACSVALSLGAA